MLPVLPPSMLLNCHRDVPIIPTYWWLVKPATIPSALYKLTNSPKHMKQTHMLIHSFRCTDKGTEALRGNTEQRQNLELAFMPTLWQWIYMQVAFKATCASVVLLKKKKKQHFLSSPQSILTAYLWHLHVVNKKPKLQRHSESSTTQAVMAKQDPGMLQGFSDLLQCDSIHTHPLESLHQSPDCVWKVVQLRTWP